MAKQEDYCKYLHDWADSHSDVGFEGMTPACFDEWANSESLETEVFAHQKQKTSFQPDKEPQCHPTSIGYELPNGAKIRCTLEGDPEQFTFTKQGWTSLDIAIEYANGEAMVLCCVDYEHPSVSRFGDRLRVLAYHEDQDDYVYEHIHPYRRYSIWITYDEGTYDVNVWDDDANERDDAMEICRLETLSEAESKMEALIRAHPSIAWTRRDLQKK